MPMRTSDSNDPPNPVPESPEPEDRSGPMRRFLVLALGWALVLLGIAGLFLPLLQGVALILVGLYVLSRESKTARRLLDRVRERHPALWAKMRRLRDRISRLARFFRRSEAGPADEAGPAEDSCATARGPRPE